MRAKLQPFREEIVKDPGALAERLTETVRVINETRGRSLVTVVQPVERRIDIVLRTEFKVSAAVVGGAWTLDGSALPVQPVYVYELKTQQDGSTLIRLEGITEGKKYAIALVLFELTGAS